MMWSDWIQENQLSDFDLASKSSPAKKLDTFANQRTITYELHVSVSSPKFMPINVTSTLFWLWWLCCTEILSLCLKRPLFNYFYVLESLPLLRTFL